MADEGGNESREWMRGVDPFSSMPGSARVGGATSKERPVFADIFDLDSINIPA